MAATYPPLLATGVTDQGRFDPFDLYGGESDIVTDQGEAATGQAIRQFEVLMRNADGKLVPWTSAGGGYATGLITVVNLLAPQLVVLGDLFTALPPCVVDDVRTMVHERSLVSRAVGGTRIETSPLGRDAKLVGAAELAFEPVLGAV